MKRIIVAVITILLTSTAFCDDLMQVYWDAYQCDPVIQKARAMRLATGEQLPQQISLLLPSVIGTGNIAWNRNLTLRATPPAAVPLGLTTFPTRSYLLTFTQPLFNLNSWFLATQAKAIDKQAEAELFAACQDLMVRVVRAYLTVLNAQDDLHYSKAQVAAYKQQLDLARKRFKLGVDTITTVYNSKASYDSSMTQLITSENNVRNSLAALTLLTGKTYCHVEELKHNVPLLPPCPIDVNLWVHASCKCNWSVIAAYYAVLAARELVKANFSNHLPTLNLVATNSRSYGQSTGLFDSANNTVGLQLSVPVFQGGYVMSQTRQAHYQYDASLADYRNQYLQAATNVRERYNDVMSGIENIKADKLAIISAAKSVSSTQAAFKVGMRSIFDVLISQRDLYVVQRQFARDQYTYLLNTVLLKQASGNLTTVDICYINSFLH